MKSRRRSAGLLLFRRMNPELEVFLVHPGGPYWARKDAGAWSIPKGEITENEDPFAAALREFHEEIGVALGSDLKFLPLGEIKQNGGKLVRAWALERDLDADRITSNTFELEWPPRSGKMAAFPEVDRAGWFPVHIAKEKLLGAQVEFLDRLASILETEPLG